MKLKTILLTVTVLSSVLFSCSEENIINGPIVSGEDVILSVNLSIKEDAVSKSGIGYENPVSDNEQLMKNYVIAIFDAGGTTRVGFKQDKFTEAQKSFTVDVVAKGGNNRQVLTIANLTDAQYTACANYTSLGEFKALEASQTTAFKSDNLMKVKLQNANLTAGQVTPLSIELVQLPARVDVAIAFNDADAKAGASFEIRGFEVTGINTASDVVLTNTVLVENTKNTTSSVTWTGDARKTFSFYTYEKETANETVNIKITGLLKENAGDAGVQKTYTYALNPVQGGECKTTGIVHGNVYKLNGLMNLTSKTVTFSVTTKDWTPVEVGADIKDVHYLFVKEHVIHMPNINSYTFEYASDLEVTYSVGDVYCIIYSSSKFEETNSYSKKQLYTVKDEQYPIFSIDKDKETITISFKALPINYAPTHFTLTVSTTTGNLSEKVDVTHYPTPYVEGEYNSLKGGGLPSGDFNHSGTIYSKNSSQDNYNIFMVTAIAAGSFKIGDPRGEDGKTRTDTEANDLVSPKFVIASQHGVYGTMSYNNAQERCGKYKEGPYDKVGSWRIPTTAELKYIATLQNDRNSGVKGLLEGDSYWSAFWFNNKGIHVNMSKASTTSSSSNTYIRCVHDVY